MDTLLMDGDFAVNDCGLPLTAAGREELLQRAWIRLRVPKGSFAYDTALGSRLSTLDPAEGDLNTRAREMAEEALGGLADVSVESVSCTPDGAGGMTVYAALRTVYGLGEVTVSIGGETDGDI